jgi:hypothetical protein
MMGSFGVLGAAVLAEMWRLLLGLCVNFQCPFSALLDSSLHCELGSIR